jgi:hypothetical protein
MGASAGREAARGCTHRRGKRLPQPSSRPWLLGTERRLTLTDARSARPTRLNPSPAWRQTQAQGRNVGHRATTPPEAGKFVSRHNNASRSMRSAGGPFAARAATKAGGFDAGAGGSGHGPADAPGRPPRHRPCCRRASQITKQPLADRLERRAIGEEGVRGWGARETRISADWDLFLALELAIRPCNSPNCCCQS